MTAWLIYKDGTERSVGARSADVARYVVVPERGRRDIDKRTFERTGERRDGMPVFVEIAFEEHTCPECVRGGEEGR